MDRERDRETERQRERQRDRETERDTEGETEREREGGRERERERQRYCYRKYTQVHKMKVSLITAILFIANTKSLHPTTTISHTTVSTGRVSMRRRNY